MRVNDLLELTFLSAAPLGIAVSLAAGVIIFRGPARLLSIAALLTGALGLVVALDILPLNYRQAHISRNSDLAALLFLLSLVLFYWRVTYHPNPRKWITLPATIGICISLFCTLFLTFDII
ncbi:hypothetical protein KO498_12375 [Lentibacter algarum]|uniref:hypothetical protein n=1 Tax=Lentibacter algarum TaxID=576131 RepID=UPI001C09BA6D|nr:hypothetical protein [Lentibacter algarum]MBU2982605.1 hypothetical protein [Lentibacter algarum]